MKFILPLVLLAAALSSCNSKVTGIVTANTPFFSSENSDDTIRIVTTGTVLEYVGDVAERVKVKLNGSEGFIDKRFIVLNVKPAVFENHFVVYDSIGGDRAHIYVGERSGQRWISTHDIDRDTANAAVAAFADALDNNLKDEETYTALARFAANHSTNPLLQVLKIDLSELPDEEIKGMQKRFHLLIDKSKNEIITSKETTSNWVDSYLTNILAVPTDGEATEFTTPRINYFYNYICELPSFVKLAARSYASRWDAVGADSLKSYLLFRMDRSPENIKRMYDTYKPVLTHAINTGSLQDVRHDMRALTTVYERIVAIPNHRTVMSDISKKIAQWDKENIDENGIINSAFTLIEQASIYEPIIDTKKYDIENNGTGIWYSSFWTRRFAEGNEKVVYDILKELLASDSEGSREEEKDPEDESNETEIITCTFQDYSVGDCGHILFSCGDYGDADISALTEEEQKLWRDLAVDDETNGASGNPEYVGKTFSIRIGTTRGPACNEGQGGEGDVPKILEFKLMN